MSTHVLVLNATYEPLNVTTIRRAVVLLLKEKAEVVEQDSVIELHAETLSLSQPIVVRLTSYVRVPRESHRRLTRRTVLARDAWECQYCGSENRLTIDHIVPRSKGGGHTWENVVTSCSPCNHRKSDRSLADVGMKLRRTPRAPSPSVFIYQEARTAPVAWGPYLAH